MNEAAAVNPFRLFFGVKFRIARNHLNNVKKHVVLHGFVAFLILGALLFGASYMFHFMFEFLLSESNQPFGRPLMNRLMGIVLLAFFSMLIFSNLIIMLTTSYISREVEFFMAQPIGHRRLFLCKLIESTFYSSWAFNVLSLPFFVALGNTAQPEAPWTFYPATAVMLIPFIGIPSAIGAIAALLLTAFVPAKKTFRFAVILVGLAILIAVATGRAMGGSARSLNSTDQIASIMGMLRAGDVAWMPSTWLARGLRAALASDWPEALFWCALMFSTALMAFQICYWLAQPLYYAGFCTSRESGSGQRRRAGGLYRFFDALARPVRPALRALVVKDLTVFWRDPAQWGQLMVLFGLLFIYVANIGNIGGLEVLRNVPLWQSLLSLFNIGAACFILSILSTRFFYPMLSLEGKQQWVIGLAPVGRTRLVWTKYWLCWASSLALVLPIALFSCAVLGTTRTITLLSVAVVTVMSLGLNSLAIGLGALMPNFGEDNPSRIANGLGGTLNVVLSLIYIGLSIVLTSPLVWTIHRDPAAGEAGRKILILSLAAAVLVHAATVFLPMRLGLRHWRRLEF